MRHLRSFRKPRPTQEPARVFVRSKNRAPSPTACFTTNRLGTCSFHDSPGGGTQRDYPGPMAYSIKPIEEERCVSLSFEGESPLREIAAARNEAHGLANTRHWNRIMVDITRLRVVPTAPELLKFAKASGGEIPRDARVALVVRPEQVQHAKLVEKAARKQGVFLSWFLDSGKAARWMQRSQAFRRKLTPKPGNAPIYNP